MNKPFFVIAVASTLAFITVGIVYAAQDSEPGDLFYPVRVWSEQNENHTETHDREQMWLQQTQEPTVVGDMLQEQDRLRIREQDRLHQNGTATPPDINGQNPWISGTPTPGSGYGLGPCTCSTCNGSQQQNQNGQENDQSEQNGAHHGNSHKP